MKYLRKTEENEKGFTLIEAMISLFVISIGLLAITKMQISSIKGNAMAMSTLRAAIEVNSSSDYLQSLTYNSLSDGDTGTITSQDGRNTTTYKVSDVSLFSGQTYKTIEMVTKWRDSAGKDKEIKSTITKLPLY